MKRRILAIAALVIGGNMLWMGGMVSSASAAPKSTTSVPVHTSYVTIHATGGLDLPAPSSCSGGPVNAYFLINQLDSPADAPATITVSFSDGSTAVYPLLTTDGPVAKYLGLVPPSTTSPPTSVTGATAVIYSEWGGKFNLSHYCDTTPVPTTSTTSTTSTSTTSTSTTSTSTTSTSTTSTSTTSIPEDTTDTTATTSTTSTTAPKHETTTTVVPSTTAPPTSVETPPTIASAGGGTTTTVKPTTTTDKVTPATVKATTTTVAQATPTTAKVVAHSGLAFTGSNSGQLTMWALGLLLMGGLLVLSERRSASKTKA